MSGARNVFDTVCSDAALSEGWHSVRTAGGKCPGPDGKTPERFQRHIFEELRELQDELRAGAYRPGPVRELRLAKPGGGTRLVHVPNVKDRVVQRAILYAAGPLLDAHFDDASHGFRPCRSVRTALDRAAELIRSGSDWAIHLDIEACFESISVKDLRPLLRASVRDARLRRLILACASAARDSDSCGRRPSLENVSLAQGFPLSPLLANLFLHQFDVAAGKAGLRVVRYADDILAVAATRLDAERSLRACEAILGRLRLRTSPRKTRLCALREGTVFLGAVITWDTRARRATWRAIPSLHETMREPSSACVAPRPAPRDTERP